MPVFTPERFDDWYQHLTNQGAHGGIVGVGMALALLPLLPPVAAWFAVVGLYLLYEAVIQSGLDDDFDLTWDWRDSLDDTANVAGGAAGPVLAFWHIADFWAAWPWVAGAYLLWLASLGYAVWRRVTP